MPDTSQPSPLVAPAELSESLERDGLVVLDIRSSVDGGGRAAFEAGHVPGAVHTDYVADGWRATRDGVPGLLPDPEILSRLFGRLGIRPDDRVVVVPAGTSAGDFSAAARVYWTLKAAGHPRLAILDGGFAAWREAGLPVESGEGRRAEAPPYPVRLRPGLRALLPDVEAAVRDGGLLVDSRGADFFAGEAVSPQAKRPGRLPGAVPFDAARAYDPARNRLRPREELLALAASLPDGPSISYCNTGHQAATDWFVLSEVLGRPDSRLYDGSMSEWTQDPARPVATGRG